MRGKLRALGGERGSVLVVFGLAMAALLAFATISLDAGKMYVFRQRLRDAADAAALAGVQFLPDDPAGAEWVANEYARLNGVDERRLEVSLAGDAASITVDVQGETPLYFAGLFGHERETLSGRARATVGLIRETRGAAPFGVPRAHFVVGESYLLKATAHSRGQGGGGDDGYQWDEEKEAYHGNFHALALGGSGASNYRKNIVEGYGGVLRVGQVVETEPGNIEGPTEQGIRERLRNDDGSVHMGSARVLVIPVVETLEVSGRKEITVVGFAAFYIEEVESGGSQTEIRGRFLRLVSEGAFGDYDPGADFGLRVIRLSD